MHLIYYKKELQT